MPSETRDFVKVAYAGGVAQATSWDWNWDHEMNSAKVRAFVELCRDLEHLGYLTVEELPRDSDYRKWALRLTAVRDA